MRRIILSLAFCLLMFASGHSSGTSAVVDYSPNLSLTLLKSTTNKERDNAVKTLKENNQNTGTPIHITAKKQQGVTVSPGDEKRHDFHFEEFSYNFAAVENAAVVRNSEKSISTENGLVPEYEKASFANGMFYGFAIMVVLLNLICYFLFDEKVFLFYSLMLVSVINLLFFSDSLFPLLGVEMTPGNFMAEAGLILINTLFATLFAARYLNLQEVSPKLLYLSLVVFGGSTVLLALSFAIEQPLLAAISNLLCFSVVTTHFGMGMYLFSRKNYPKFYVIAYFIPLLFAVDYFVFRNLGIDFLLSQPVHLKAAILVEMLLMSYAIMYRMKAIKEENELRQAELRIFLKRQEMINRQSAMQLMEDVYLENLIMHYDLDGLEIKLLQYISEGKDNAKIARKLKTTESEIEELTNELYQKLEIGEQVQQDYRMVQSQPDYIYN